MFDPYQKICTPEEELEWYVAVGAPVERLSLLSECYKKVNRLLAYRFIMPNLHVLTEETLSGYLKGPDDEHIEDVDSSKMDPEIIRDFLVRGNDNEIHEFVQSYLQNIQSALKSRMFRDYVILNIRFTVIAYIESMGSAQEDYIAEVKNRERICTWRRRRSLNILRRCCIWQSISGTGKTDTRAVRC